MIIQTIHLSDLHIKTKFNVKKQVDKIIESLTFKEGTKPSFIFICVTGDLTNDGSKEYFTQFKSFIAELTTRLKKESGLNVEVLFIPGNHDIKIDSNKNRISEIHNTFNKNDISAIDTFLEKDLQNMKNFFDLSKEFNLFSNNKLIDVKTYRILNKKIKFILINTSPFSSLNKDDKDIHYINDSSFEKEICGDADFTITLMHHSSEWFSELCIEKINEIIISSNICLFGHSHFNSKVLTDNETKFISGPFNIFGEGSSNFSIFLINIEDMTLKKFKVIYDITLKKYVRNSEFEHFPLITKNLKITLNKKEDCYKTILVDDIKFDLNDIFVMPQITYEDKQKKLFANIKNFDNLISYIKEKKYIRLIGYKGSGKTTLSHKIANYFLKNNKYVLYFDGSINITNSKENTLNNLFTNNYKEILLNDFLQVDSQNKILIIDGVDNFNEKTIDFIKYCKEIFGVIIVTASVTFRSKKDLFTNYNDLDFNLLKIELFSIKEREELVKKISIKLNVFDDVDDINKYLSLLKRKGTFLNLCLPDNLCLIITKLIQNKWYLERDTKSAYSITFDDLIKRLIFEYKGNINPDDIMLFFSEIAYKIYEENYACVNFISEQNLFELFLQLNNEYGFNASANEFLNYFTKSRIIEKTSRNGINGYGFVRGAYLCYFMAEKMIYLENNEKNNLIKIVQELEDNILRGYNSDILLFYTYKTQKISFFDNLIQKLNNLTSGSKVLSFDERNNFILKRISYLDFKKISGSETKSEFKNRIDNDERKLIKHDEETIDEEHNLSTNNDDINTFLKNIKFIEIIAKGLGGFRGRLTLNSRKLMLDCLYTNLYKIFYQFFDFDEKSYNEVSDYLYSKIIEKKGKISKDELDKILTNIFYDVITTFILNISTNIAQIMISNSSIDVIKNFNVMQGDNSLCLNAFIFKLIALERYGNFDLFYNFLSKYFDKIEAKDFQNLTRRVVSLFIISSKISQNNAIKLGRIVKFEDNYVLNILGVTNK